MSAFYYGGRMLKENKIKCIAVLIIILTYILNCSVTYTITCTNGEQIEVSQKVIHYILGLD